MINGWIVLQIHPNSRGGDLLKSSDCCPVGLGVLAPISADGFYDSKELAEEVAEYMASIRPDLETMVAQVHMHAPPFLSRWNA